jgi:hypothetical protein
MYVFTGNNYAGSSCRVIVPGHRELYANGTTSSTGIYFSAP